MIEAEVIVVGGGPAGSTCGWKLRTAGTDVLILDKQTFPRTKICAGWVTPNVWQSLGIAPADYPSSLVVYDRILFRIKGIPVPVRTRQYAIRRFEFDDFLLRRSGARFQRHTVNVIHRKNDGFEVDGKYRCRFLIGAGGTHCPVYRTFFRRHHPREDGRRIATAEIEFPRACRDMSCRLWFFDDGLPGYSWYVPKANGFLNVGIGGKAAALKQKGGTIREHWNRFVHRLEKEGRVKGVPEPRGHIYYLRHASGPVRLGNALLVGDAAGLATLDLGEGIGPAVESGLAAADAIITGRPYRLNHIHRMSIPRILRHVFSG